MISKTCQRDRGWYIFKTSKDHIYSQNFNFLSTLYFRQLLKFQTIKCPQYVDFLTINMIFGHFKNFSQKIFYGKGFLTQFHILSLLTKIQKGHRSSYLGHKWLNISTNSKWHIVWVDKYQGAAWSLFGLFCDIALSPD